MDTSTPNYSPQNDHIVDIYCIFNFPKCSVSQKINVYIHVFVSFRIIRDHGLINLRKFQSESSFETLLVLAATVFIAAQGDMRYLAAKSAQRVSMDACK